MSTNTQRKKNRSIEYHEDKKKLHGKTFGVKGQKNCRVSVFFEMYFA